MGNRLNREKCSALVEEFADFYESEKGMELSPDGEKLIRTFVESICTDEVVQKKFDELVKAEQEENGNGINRNPSASSSTYHGEERRKARGGYHLWEKRRTPHNYGSPSEKNSRAVLFGKSKSARS